MDGSTTPKRKTSPLLDKTRTTLVVSVALILGVGVGIIATQAVADYIQCSGGVCYGTEESDGMDGTDGYDDIHSFGGQDRIHAADHGDDSAGGSNADRVWGEGGWDDVNSGDDHDFWTDCNDTYSACGAMGQNGQDTVHGGSDTDWVEGGSDNDTILGDDGCCDEVEATDGSGGDFADGGGGGSDSCDINPGDTAVRCQVYYH